MKPFGIALYVLGCLLTGLNTYFALHGSVLNLICIPLALWSAWIGYGLYRREAY